MDVRIIAAVDGAGGVQELLDHPSEFGPGAAVTGPGGAVLKLESMETRRSLDAGVVVQLLLTFAATVSANVLAAWLHDKLKSARARRMWIDRTEIELDQGEIERIVREKIEYEG